MYLRKPARHLISLGSAGGSASHLIENGIDFIITYADNQPKISWNSGSNIGFISCPLTNRIPVTNLTTFQKSRKINRFDPQGGHNG